MSESTDSEHLDQVAGYRAAAAQRIEVIPAQSSGAASPVETIGHRRYRFPRGDQFQRSRRRSGCQSIFRWGN